ncbi:M20/M25/M40 family metallo-hydrolase [Roseococcus sp. SYP-B2431]|uniref:M20/M25/M40 family metallo-hydrolase n=1 Tax=Roseococcus sp. SYP-B2431 TaxID=2496640 RepID=UPI00103BBE22|nr:M20/M25/M40 family metallo-hydrolase [Roseococcus sp. SYP-B2431]TCI00321.1 M20/M25/M40 family metallo-hydrolase [Roseococcus sp. SYP-B2431]
MTTDETIAAIRSAAGYRTACDTMRAEHDRIVEDIIALTEIPSPPFGEEKRAAAYLAMLKAHGLEEVGQDEVGNVFGLRRGFGNGDIVVVAAHLDTVFPAGTDVRVRREGTRLYAPGVGDDTRSLAVNLGFLRAMDAAGIRTRHDILFVGDVGEEGLGDLRGIRHLFAQHPKRERIRAFFTVDSPEVDRIVTGGIGSRRYRVAFKGPGGHSFAAFGMVNPMYAMAEAARTLAAIEVPREPVTTHCVSVVGGGTSINAIPETVTMEVDLRSASLEELDKLDKAFLAGVDQAVAAENAARDGTITAELIRVGDRPAGHTPNGAPIARLAAAAVAAEGYTPSFEWSSTDANIPMSLGIPALRIGSGGKGGRAHSLEEWIDVEIEGSLRGMRASLATILAVAEMETA